MFVIFVFVYMCCVVLFCYLCVMLCFIFFFFKQKTAYEMRISDWSSDVCSSDLPIAANCGYGRASFEFEPIRGLMAKEELLEMRGQEIGRASCRERVCQYV